MCKMFFALARTCLPIWNDSSWPNPNARERERESESRSRNCSLKWLYTRVTNSSHPCCCCGHLSLDTQRFCMRSIYRWWWCRWLKFACQCAVCIMSLNDVYCRENFVNFRNCASVSWSGHHRPAMKSKRTAIITTCSIPILASSTLVDQLI